MARKRATSGMPICTPFAGSVSWLAGSTSQRSEASFQRAGSTRPRVSSVGSARSTCHSRAAQGLARTFQITNLFPDLSVLENCVLAVQAQTPTRFAMLRPVGAFTALHARASATLLSVGLQDIGDAVVKNLSHGEQRQLEIALALAGRPRVLLLDEPTAGLSPAESRLMAGLLARLDPAITVLMIEHDMDIALELSAHVTVLHYGRVIADGSREAIRADPQVREIYLGA